MTVPIREKDGGPFFGIHKGNQFKKNVYKVF